MRYMRCLVGAAVLAPNYGKTLAIGQVVDLEERLPNGGTLADHVDPAWFEAITPEPSESEIFRRRRMAAATEPAPASVAAPSFRSSSAPVAPVTTIADSPSGARTRRGLSQPATPAHKETDHE